MSDEKKHTQEVTKPQTTEIAKKVDVPGMLADADGLILSNLKDIVQFGKYVVASKMFPALTDPTHVVVCFQLARDHKVPVSLVLQNTAFINGRATVWGDCLLGMAMATGDMTDFEETISGTVKEGTLSATCRVVSKRFPTPVIRTFTWEDATVAGLNKKDTYAKWPKRMLQMRARSWALRDAGLTTGVMATEEAQDTETIVDTSARVVHVTDGKPHKFDFANKPKDEGAKSPESTNVQPEPEQQPAEAEEPEDDAPTGDLFGQDGQFTDLIEAVNNEVPGCTKDVVRKAIDAMLEAGVEVTMESTIEQVKAMLKR